MLTDCWSLPLLRNDKIDAHDEWIMHCATSVYSRRTFDNSLMFTLYKTIKFCLMANESSNAKCFYILDQCWTIQDDFLFQNSQKLHCSQRQNGNCTASVHSDEKLNDWWTFPFTRTIQLVFATKQTPMAQFWSIVMYYRTEGDRLLSSRTFQFHLTIEKWSIVQFLPILNEYSTFDDRLLVCNTTEFILNNEKLSIARFLKMLIEYWTEQHRFLYSRIEVLKKLYELFAKNVVPWISFHTTTNLHKPSPESTHNVKTTTPASPDSTHLLLPSLRTAWNYREQGSVSCAGSTAVQNDD